MMLAKHKEAPNLERGVMHARVLMTLKKFEGLVTLLEGTNLVGKQL